MLGLPLSLAAPAPLKPYRRALPFALHVLLIPTSYLGAFALRFDLRLPPDALAAFAGTAAYLLALRLLMFERFGLFKGYWRHVGLRDLVALTSAVTLSSILFLATLYVIGRLDVLPRSVLALDWLMMVFLSGGLRFGARAFQEGQLPLRAPRGKRTIVIGAGEAAEQFLRQIQHDARDTMHVVGLIDDDPDARGRTLHGVPVLGGTDELPRLVEEHRPALLVIAIPSASAEALRRMVDRCVEAGVPFKILPSLQELLEGRAHIGQLRDVQIEDLLGRAPVDLDLSLVARELQGSSVLITGGAGSIGSELARQVARFRPRQVVLLERAESALYFVHLEIARAHPDVDVVPVIANITNAERMDEVLAAYRPDYVFHAAAYKHVPLMEASVVEAVWNNAVGTYRVARAAARAGVRKFVLISTDKAVNPTSVMGATKRMAERIVLELGELAASATEFRAVRFGNVLGSDGSVVPLFRRQLAQGGPVTVTHPEVERYFMTIPEAVQLVLMASSLPEAARCVAILEMGRPVRILHLAEQLIRLNGLVPHQDVKIIFTGLRPGEKLYEELVGARENAEATSQPKVRVVTAARNGGAPVEAGLATLLEALTRSDVAALMGAIATLVPDYVSDPALAEAAPAPARHPRGRLPALPRLTPVRAEPSFSL